MENLNYLIAFGGGIASFISPCVLPMVPIYLAIISGISIEEMKTGKGSLLRVIAASLLFILGFTLVFAMLGLAVSILADSFYKALFNLILGILIIFFGLHYTGLLRISILDREKRFHAKKGGILKAFIVGFLFAFGWTPCIGPILGAILAMPAGNSLIKVSYTVTYSLGLAVPFLISAIGINAFYKIFDKIKHHFKKVELIIGLILILLGSYYIYEVIYSGDLFSKKDKIQITDTQRQKGANFSFSINNKLIELKDLNKKLYVINLWTTWCPNCIKELPYFSDIYNEMKEKQVYILGICVEDSSSNEIKFKEIIDRLNLKFPVYFDKKGLINQYLREFYPESKSISGYPLTLILNKNRQVIKQIIGAKSKEQWKDLIKKNIP